MHARRFCLVLAGVLLIPARGGATDHKFEASLEASGERGSLLRGVQGSVAFALQGHPNLTLVAQFTRNRGSHDDMYQKRFAHLDGLRYHWGSEKRRFQPFAQLLVGVMQTAVNDVPSHGWFLAPGGGVDYNLTSGEKWAARVQADYLINLNLEGNSHLRFSAGFVLRLHHD